LPTPWRLSVSNNGLLERSAVFSPEGKWVVYESDETGQFEIYAQKFTVPPSNSPVRSQLTDQGGRFPRWRRDGRELYFVAGDGRLVALPVSTTDSTFVPGSPEPLFSLPLSVSGASTFMYDAAAGRRRFVIIAAADDAARDRVNVLVNWPSQRRRASFSP